MPFSPGSARMFSRQRPNAETRHQRPWNASGRVHHLSLGADHLAMGTSVSSTRRRRALHARPLLPSRVHSQDLGNTAAARDQTDNSPERDAHAAMQGLPPITSGPSMIRVSGVMGLLALLGHFRPGRNEPPAAQDGLQSREVAVARDQGYSGLPTRCRQQGVVYEGRVCVSGPPFTVRQAGE